MRLTRARFRAAWAVAALISGALTFYFATGDLNDPTIPAFTTRQSHVAHFTACALVAFCAVTAIFSRSLLVALAVALVVAACGAAIEVYQHFLPTRSASLADATADASGALTGAVLAWLLMPLWYAMFRPRRERRPRTAARRRRAAPPDPRGFTRPPKADQRGG